MIRLSNVLLSILTCTDPSTPHLRGQSRPRTFGAQFAELAGKVCDEAVPDLVALMEENRKVIGKSLALAELCDAACRLPGRTRPRRRLILQPGPPHLGGCTASTGTLSCTCCSRLSQCGAGVQQGRAV
jgi:hypothetical protein